MAQRVRSELLIIGIDATNLRGGGGLTHLLELLQAAHPIRHGFDRIVVWSGAKTLSALDDRLWLDKRNPPDLDKGLIKRSLWQCFHLAKAVRNEGCSVLFVPGGSYAGSFHPVVTVSQNLLPFDISELRRYGVTLFALKLLFLRLTQTFSFRRSDGIIFLSEYARAAVLHVSGQLSARICKIPHGLNPRFNKPPKVQYPISFYDEDNPFRLIYVSIIDLYKHQWHLVKAIASLREQGFPIVLDLVGPAYPSALLRLNATINQYDPDRRWVNYRGSIPFNKLHQHYTCADLGVFASSCENMPNILLETMASGLPIACSNRGPMPEVLGRAGVYFDPENSTEIFNAVRELILSPQLRAENAQLSYQTAQKYTWNKCADDTFSFLASCAEKYKKVI